jgi:endonuclease/exonuclease/phosphatase family metal-dependent hydrolase
MCRTWSMPKKRRLILGVLAALLLVFLYRVLTVYTVRSGECRPLPTSPGAERTGSPQLRRPLLVMTYNIAGHDELIDGDHVRHIAEAIQRIKPDIVALQEVHRGTWQARFSDQLAELESRTGLNGYFAPSYVQWGGGYGNAILTRGEFVQTQVHPLPCIGEPRALLEATIRIDGATISFYATHLTSWGRFNSKIRAEQLQCLAREVRASRHPYILAGDLNTDPDSPEMAAFLRGNAAQLASKGIGPTFPFWDEQIDYIFAGHGWQVRASRTWPIETSDHLPVTAELAGGQPDRLH